MLIVITYCLSIVTFQLMMNKICSYINFCRNKQFSDLHKTLGNHNNQGSFICSIL